MNEKRIVARRKASEARVVRHFEEVRKVDEGRAQLDPSPWFPAHVPYDQGLLVSPGDGVDLLARYEALAVGKPADEYACHTNVDGWKGAARPPHQFA